MKPSILKKGKYQSKLTEESDEMPLKQSQPAARAANWRGGSFRLSKKDSSRSITSQDQTLQSSISTFNSSISSIASDPCLYDELSSGNESLSSLLHVEELKTRRSPNVQAEQVQTRKARSMSLSNKRAPRLPAPLKIAQKVHPQRSSTVVEAEQVQPRKPRSKSLCNKRVPRMQRSSSGRCVTNAQVVVVPRKSTVTEFKTCLNSLDDYMDEYSKIMDDFPDARSQNNTDCCFDGSKSVTGW
jgi:hypothetical protein